MASLATDHAFAACYAANAGYEAGAGYRFLVDAVRGQLRELEEGRKRVEDCANPIAREQLAPRDVAGACALAAAKADHIHALAQLGNQRRHALGVGAEGRGAWIDLGGEDGHYASPCLLK